MSNKPKKFTRRKFIKNSATLGAAGLAGSYFLPDIIHAVTKGNPDIVSVTGENYYHLTVEAVDMLGSIGRFVTPGSRVAVLPNATCEHPATAVNPSVLMAVLEMCYQAGAKEVILIKGVVDNYWNGMELSTDQQELIKRTTVTDKGYIVLPIKEGLALKEAHISKDLMESDLFINVGLMKHHSGTNYTGILKNLMGACPHDPTCKFFHFGSNAGGWYEDVDFLSQCVANLNLLRKADLLIGDSTKFITTNGPFGPGEIGQTNTVTAGLNAVAVDAHCTKYLGLKPENVSMIGLAAKHGLGEADLSKMNIKEISI